MEVSQLLQHFYCTHLRRYISALLDRFLFLLYSDDATGKSIVQERGLIAIKPKLKKRGVWIAWNSYKDKYNNRQASEQTHKDKKSFEKRREKKQTSFAITVKRNGQRQTNKQPWWRRRQQKFHSSDDDRSIRNFLLSH